MKFIIKKTLEYVVRVCNYADSNFDENTFF